MKRPLLLVFLLASLAGAGHDALGQGQAPTLVGNAESMGGGVYRISSAATGQRGAIWFQNRINLNQPFDLSYTINVGNNDAGGADGICFVLQNHGYDALGGGGGAMGYIGMEDSSLAVEVDTWDNRVNGADDVAEDHIAVDWSGMLSPGLTSPVLASATSANIEDGLDHTLRVAWTPRDTTLRVYFDDSLRVTLRHDVVNRVFGGNADSLIWGFTAATGSGINDQRIFNVELTSTAPPTQPRMAEDYALYPNPANGKARVVIYEPTPYSQLQVLDAAGRVVSSYSLPEGQRSVQVDLAGKRPGHYFIRLWSLDALSRTGRITVLK